MQVALFDTEYIRLNVKIKPVKAPKQGAREAVSRYSGIKNLLDTDKLTNGNWVGVDTTKVSDSTTKFTFMDLFSGAGGISHAESRFLLCAGEPYDNLHACLADLSVIVLQPPWTPNDGRGSLPLNRPTPRSPCTYRVSSSPPPRSAPPRFSPSPRCQSGRS